MCAGEKRSEDDASDSLQPLSEDQRQTGRRQQHPPPAGQVSADTDNDILKLISVYIFDM